MLRIDPPLQAGEHRMLLAFLDYQRETVAAKVEGLDADQLATTHPPSTMTLGGLLNHLALVESDWVSNILLGETEEEPWASAPWEVDVDWDWHTAHQLAPEDLLARWRAAVGRSRTVLADLDLDTLSQRPSRRPEEGFYSARWIVLHLIEEYARHAGHADLIRESIDGATGE